MDRYSSMQEMQTVVQFRRIGASEGWKGGEIHTRMAAVCDFRTTENVEADLDNQR
jgi:hypothetical protein